MRCRRMQRSASTRASPRQLPKNRQEEPIERKPFIPYQPERRRPGTGYLKQIKEDLWEGRYSRWAGWGKALPLMPHQGGMWGETVGADPAKWRRRSPPCALVPSQNIQTVSAPRKAARRYLRGEPLWAIKSCIARQLGMDVSTVRRKYYDEIRAELAGQEVQMATYQEIGCWIKGKKTGAGRDRHGACDIGKWSDFNPIIYFKNKILQLLDTQRLLRIV